MTSVEAHLERIEQKIAQQEERYQTSSDAMTRAVREVGKKLDSLVRLLVLALIVDMLNGRGLDRIVELAKAFH